MSSHWEWAEERMREHDAQKPYAPENGQALQFKPGDKVIYTNEFGVEFAQTVTGYYLRPEKPCGQYANGARYFLDTSAHWFPHTERSLRAAA
jgi:hypothetical protein